MTESSDLLSGFGNQETSGAGNSLMNAFDMEIRTPAECHPGRRVNALDVPAEEGRLTVLAGHQPLVCAVTGGTVRIVDADGTTERWTVGPGFMSVARDGTMLLVDAATRDE
jgi:F-type H+-transporting ATPase subunit epsilon